MTVDSYIIFSAFMPPRSPNSNAAFNRLYALLHASARLHAACSLLIKSQSYIAKGDSSQNKSTRFAFGCSPQPLKPKKSDLVNAALQVSLVNAHNVSVWAAGLKFRRATMRKGGTQRLYGEFRRHYRPDSPISGGNGERIIAALIYSNSRSRRILIHLIQGIRVTLPESSTQQ